MIKEVKQKKAFLIFAGFLVLGGFCHTLDKITHAAVMFWPSAFMFSAVLLIYSGLILYWVQSVRRRLLPSPARSYMIASGMLMEFFLVVRTVSHRIRHAGRFAS